MGTSAHTSMALVYRQTTMAWFRRAFALVDVPGGYYQLVGHPPFDYSVDNEEVMRRVEDIAFGKECAVRGFKWKQDGQCYQRHYPEGHGYMVLRPIERS